MKKETLKEIGKFHLDIAKIVAGLAIISPIIKGETVSIFALSGAMYLGLVGFGLINKGAKNE